MTHSPTPWSINRFGNIVDANGTQVFEMGDKVFIFEAVNSYEPREDLIRKLITALADVRDRNPEAWKPLQEHVLDLSREMGF